MCAGRRASKSQDISSRRQPMPITGKDDARGASAGLSPGRPWTAILIVDGNLSTALCNSFCPLYEPTLPQLYILGRRQSFTRWCRHQSAAAGLGVSPLQLQQIACRKALACSRASASTLTTPNMPVKQTIHAHYRHLQQSPALLLPRSWGPRLLRAYPALLPLPACSSCLLSVCQRHSSGHPPPAMYANLSPMSSPGGRSYDRP
jgi:hypothetical protein